MNKKIIVLIAAITSIGFFLYYTDLPELKYSLKVVDQNGIAVSDADVSYSFVPGSTIDKLKHLKTDSKGIVSFHGRTPFAGAGCDITKKGYYETRGYSGKMILNRVLNQWEPWNKTQTAVLKKIKKPVAMYAQATPYLKFPVLGELIGYDLEKGDWMAPYGKGLNSDLIFSFKHEYQTNRKFFASALISFKNELDGIQIYEKSENLRSQFHWPYEAPLEGYQKNLDKFISSNWNGKQGHLHNIIDRDGSYQNGLYREKKDTYYIFRIRTVLDVNGKIISAKYGKIQGDFQLSRGGHLQFTYFLNPTGTRHLEFDMRKNLFEWSQKQWERTNILKP